MWYNSASGICLAGLLNPDTAVSPSERPETTDIDSSLKIFARRIGKVLHKVNNPQCNLQKITKLTETFLYLSNPSYGVEEDEQVGLATSRFGNLLEQLTC
ncbi:MAG: hypothetical protein NZO16_00490 [Deltaproteobacteria bacterium]|nr:hypothetical protein [Deltaproteobacteria bacterium]